MKLNNNIMNHVKDQLTKITTGVVAITLAKDTKKLYVLTTNFDDSETNRSIGNEFMEKIREKAEAIDYGKVSIHIEDGDEMKIVSEERRRFLLEDESKKRVVRKKEFRQG